MKSCQAGVHLGWIFVERARSGTVTTVGRLKSGQGVRWRTTNVQLTQAGNGKRERGEGETRRLVGGGRRKGGRAGRHLSAFTARVAREGKIDARDR